MCGIFGGNNDIDYTDLYELNKERGDFSFGAYTNYAVLKSKEPNYHALKVKGGGVRGFHTRAPTSFVTEFNEYDSHPFQYGSVIVGHNGIIENHTALRQKYGYINDISQVDSAIIPVLIHQFRNSERDNIQAISKTLSLLKGTFALWIVIGFRMYLARSSSTLYSHQKDSNILFSSYPVNKEVDVLLDEGKIYELSDELRIVGEFKTKTPFFVAS